MRSESVPADAHVGPQLQRRSCHSRLCGPPPPTSNPTPATLIQIRGLIPPPSANTRVCCHAASHTLCLAPRQSNPDVHRGVERGGTVNSHDRMRTGLCIQVRMYAWSQRGPHTLETLCGAATDIEKSSSCVSSVSALVCNIYIPVCARSDKAAVCSENVL